MTNKKPLNNLVTSIYEDPKILFNTLVKLPGIDFDSEEIIKFVDLYMNSLINVEDSEGKNVLKELPIHVSMAVLGGPLYKTEFQKTALSLDKTILHTEDLCKTLARSKDLNYLKEALIILNFGTTHQFLTGTTNASKNYLSPFAINCELPKNSYAAQQIIPHCESYSSISYEVSNMIISFSGESNINFAPILDVSKKAVKPEIQLNEQFGIAKYILSSNLVKQTSMFGDAINIGHLLENYIKPRFLKSNFEFVVVQQDDIENVYFSKGCKEISKGLWITNPFGYKLMQNADLISPNSSTLKVKLKEAINLHLKKQSVTTESKVIQYKSVNTPSEDIPSKSTQMVPSSLFNLDLTNEKILEELKQRNSLKVNPALIHLCSAILGKDYVTSDLKIIPKGSKVTLSQSIVNSLSIEQPYLCTILNKNNNHTYSEVLHADKINEFMILIPDQKFSTLLTNYSNMLKELYGSKEPFMEDILQLKEILISGNNSHTLENLIKNNYSIDMLKINGYKRYGWMIRAMVLVLIDHVYYNKQDYTKLNMLGTLPISSYLKMFIHTIEEVKKKSNPELITNIKLGLLTESNNLFD